MPVFTPRIIDRSHFNVNVFGPPPYSSIAIRRGGTSATGVLQNDYLPNRSSDIFKNVYFNDLDGYVFTDDPLLPVGYGMDGGRMIPLLNNDGTLLIMVQSTLREFALATPYRVASAQYTGKSNALGYSINSAFFNLTGDKLFLVSSSVSDFIFTEFSLSTPFDISTIVATGNTKTVTPPTPGNRFRAFTINQGGTRAILTHYTPFNGATTYLAQYRLSPAFDISSITYTGKQFYPSSQITFDAGNGTPHMEEFTGKLYVPNTVGMVGTAVFDVNPLDITTATYTTTYSQDPTFNPYTAAFVYAPPASAPANPEYSLPWSGIKLSYVGSSTYNAVTGTVTGAFLTEDGLNLFISSNATLYHYQLSTAFNFSTATMIASKTGMNGLVNFRISPDGTKLYGHNNTTTNPIRMFRYTMSPWDVTTLVADANCQWPPGYGARMLGLDFSPDGRSMYFSSDNNTGTGDYMGVIILDTPWTVPASVSPIASLTTNYRFRDIIVNKTYGNRLIGRISTTNVLTSATFGSAVDRYGGNEQDPNTSGDNVAVNWPVVGGVTNGRMFSAQDRIFTISTDGLTVNEYTCQTPATYTRAPWKLQAAFHTNNRIFEEYPLALNRLRAAIFSADGSQLYVAGGLNADSDYPVMFQYALSTPWDISSVYLPDYDHRCDFYRDTLVDVTFSIGDAAFSPDGQTLLITGGANILRFQLGTPWLISSATWVGSTPIPGVGSITGSCFDPSGTRMYMVSSSTDRIHQFSLSTAWDITTISYTGLQSFAFTTFNGITNAFWELTATGVVISSDGTTVIWTGSYSGKLYSATLGTPWDISTAVYDNVSFKYLTNYSSYVGSGMNGIHATPDGSKMLITTQYNINELLFTALG